jgi:hypothetical protein
LSELENLSYGIGQGQVGQLEGYEAIIRQPAAVIAALYRAASNPRQTITAMAADAMQKARGGPIGIGQLLGESFSPRSLLGVNAVTTAMNKPGLLQELDVYHGTPHRFPPTEANPLGEFDASKIGTGEGAQAYGHGLYFAQRPGVAKEYQTRLSRAEVELDGAPFTPNTNGTDAQSFALRAMGKVENDPIEVAKILRDTAADDSNWIGYSGDERALRPKYVEAADWLEKNASRIKLRKGGQFYTVDLPDDMVERMIDWDKPINEQSKPVLDALEKAGINTQSTALAGPMARGQEAHLAKHGIPGVRYLDAGSRGKDGTGTRNFVVFPGEEKRVRILKRE